MNFRIYKLAALFLLFMALTLQLSAANIVTSLVRVDLSKQKPTTLLTITNKGSTKTILQIDPVTWQQKGGEDLYKPTDDILAVPTLFELKPGESQLIRVGMRSEPDSDQERAYRLYINEIPDAAAQVPDSVHVTLRIGIPVFLHSARVETSNLQWSAMCMKEGILHLEVSNNGNSHDKIHALSLKNKEGKNILLKSKLADYILAGTSRSWDLVDSDCSKVGKILELSATTDAGAVNAQISLKE